MPPNNYGYQSMDSTECGPKSKSIDEARILHTNSTKLFTLEEIAKHDTFDDCWVIEKDFVYDVTEFLGKHPGGAELILNYGGKNVTDLLDNVNFHRHTSAAYNLLKDYRIGKVKTCKNDGHHIPEEFSMDGYMEDLVDWNRGMVFQVHKLGKQYMKWVNSPVDRKLRLFDSSFIEFFSKTPWYMIPVVWLPVIMALSFFSLNQLYVSVSDGMMAPDADYFYKIMLTFLSFALCFGFGFPFWTLVEYLLHRYLFHLEPKDDSPLLITFHFFIHGQHHKVPFDTNRLVFPPVAASVIAYTIYAPMTTALPGGFGQAIFAGGLVGYVFYDLMHYYLHHGTPERGSYLHSLKYYHVLHHFDDHSTGYGISTKFWDYPFATVNKKVM